MIGTKPFGLAYWTTASTRVGVSGTTAKSRQRKFVPSSHLGPFALMVSPGSGAGSVQFSQQLCTSRYKFDTFSIFSSNLPDYESILANAIFSIFKMATLMFKMVVKLIII